MVFSVINALALLPRQFWTMGNLSFAPWAIAPVDIARISMLPEAMALLGMLAGGMWLSRWFNEAPGIARSDIDRSDIDRSDTNLRARLAELQKREARHQVLMEAITAEAGRLQAQLDHDALHDPLTDLLNRRGLLQKLDQILAQAQREHRYQYAVLCLDLGRFKRINNSMGYEVGDQLLVAIAKMLRAQVPGTDSVARLGADEFVVLLESVALPQLTALLQGILAGRQGLRTAEGQEFFVDLTIGVVAGTPQYRRASDVIRNAGIAVQQARSISGNGFAFFNPQMQTQVTQQLKVEAELRRALASEELAVHYQPIVDLGSQALVGFEALVRWQHPTQQLVGPEAFIDVAEETGLINRLDQWVFYQACEQLAAWISQFGEAGDLTMSVNLSVRDLNRPQLLTDIDATLAKTGLAGQSVVIEITETLLIDDTARIIERLRQLAQRGIRIAIDDFGTGYSSLSYLNQLPVHHVKIDKTFVDQMQSAHHQRQIVRAVVDLSHQLSMVAIAEGIETAAQLQALQALGCDFGQGYLFSKPLPASEIEAQFFCPSRLTSGLARVAVQ